MSERDRQLERDIDVDVGVDTGIDEPVGETAAEDTTASEGVRGRLRSGTSSLVSSTGLVVALVLSVGGAVLLSGVPLLGTVGELLGILVAGFIYGLVGEARRYLELAVAGALVGGGFAVLGNLTAVLLTVGVPLVVLGAVGGAVAGVVGHYFGRDLRDGLTRDL
ncbi:MAG: hypothetical protein V5A55_06945 [Halovenus sp.]